MVKKIISIALALGLLVYMITPGPSGIGDFKSLPNAAKSTLPGDSIEIPTIAAYYSDNYRAFATTFYKANLYERTSLPFGPIRLNYPPESAFAYIKDQTHATYLEEYVYPLRNSLFVAGLEPFEDGKPRYQAASLFGWKGVDYQTKVTLRFYPSSLVARIVVWLGIVVSGMLIYGTFKQIKNLA